jgi:hypothetical protein
MEQQTVIPGMESLAVREQQQPTPMVLLQMAMSQNADIEKLSKLMDLHERWEKTEARKAFDHAFAAFKSESVKSPETSASPTAHSRARSTPTCSQSFPRPHPRYRSTD